MNREFVILPTFDKRWRELGLTEDELKELQAELLLDPECGDMMRGTGGVRKLRFAFGGRGKRGSVRVIYVDFLLYEKLYLLTAYAKVEKDNLSNEERNRIKNLVEGLKQALREGGKTK